MFGLWTFGLRMLAFQGEHYLDRCFRGCGCDETACDNHESSSFDEHATASAANDQIEKEYQKLVDDDDAAQAEVDKWIQDNNQFAAKGAGVPAEELNRRIKEQFAPIRKRYEDFIKKHPDHARIRVAYASFLGDMHDEEGAQVQLEKALETGSEESRCVQQPRQYLRPRWTD
jgi:Tfp pilus assembly protein PilF